MNLHGAKFAELYELIAAVAREGDWRLQGQYWIAEMDVSGIPLKVRQRFNGPRMEMVSITGRGWMISFQVQPRRPVSMPDEQQSEYVAMPYPREPSDPKLYGIWLKTIANPNLTQTGGGWSDSKRMCLHTEAVLSPENFRTDMTLLRLFSSQWSL